MKLYDVGVNNKGTTLILWVCDDDEKNIKEYRGSLKAVLQHVFSDLVLNDWNKVVNELLKEIGGVGNGYLLHSWENYFK